MKYRTKSSTSILTILKALTFIGYCPDYEAISTYLMNTNSQTRKQMALAGLTGAWMCNISGRGIRRGRVVRLPCSMYTTVINIILTKPMNEYCVKL